MMLSKGKPKSTWDGITVFISFYLSLMSLYLEYSGMVWDPFMQDKPDFSGEPKRE